MELGMFTSGYQRCPLERAFADARDLGYDYIELWGGRPHAFAPDLKRGELKEVLALSEQYAMPVRVYTPEHNAYPYNYMTGSRLQWEDTMDYLKLCLDMGKALGAEHTLISVGHGGCGVPRRELWKRLTDSLRVLAAHAETIGHSILLESLTPWESNLCNTAGELAQGLEGVGSPCLLGMCDGGPPAAAGEPSPSAMPETTRAPAWASSSPMRAAIRRPYSEGFRLPTTVTASSSSKAGSRPFT